MAKDTNQPPTPEPCTIVQLTDADKRLANAGNKLDNAQARQRQARADMETADRLVADATEEWNEASRLLASAIAAYKGSRLPTGPHQ